MRTIITVAWAIVALVALPARADEPLLVAVEINGRAGVSADEARAAVAAEVEDGVVSPGEGSPPTLSGTLIVHVGERSARFTFLPKTGATRERQIDLPPQHDQRLKTIGWIALNLVKNQIGEVGPVDGEPQPLPSPAVPPSPIEPPLAPPPPSVVSDAKPFGETPIAAKSVETEAEATSTWRMAVFGGPTLHPMDSRGWEWQPWRSGNEWQIEAIRSRGTWETGLALDVGEKDIPMAALAVFVGDGWQWRRLRLAGTVGAGLELTKRSTTKSVVHYDSSTGLSTSQDVSTELRPRPYGRANATLGWRFGRSVDLMLRVAIHLASDDKMYSYGTALLGVGFPLP